MERPSKDAEQDQPSTTTTSVALKVWFVAMVQNGGSPTRQFITVVGARRSSRTILEERLVADREMYEERLAGARRKAEELEQKATRLKTLEGEGPYTELRLLC
eukprot:37669-Eustigmatos_ZCMA.PRE.1